MWAPSTSASVIRITFGSARSRVELGADAGADRGGSASWYLDVLSTCRFRDFSTFRILRAAVKNRLACCGRRPCLAESAGGIASTTNSSAGRCP